MNLDNLDPETVSIIKKEIHGMTYLNLGGYKLDKIPDFVFDMDNLGYLDLSYNNLSEINEIPSDLIYLSIRYNNIKYYDFANKGLKRIILEGNRINEVPLINSDNLLAINLSFNKLEQFPELKTKNIILLNLHGNRIFHVPDDLCRLSNLVKLYLGFNKIERLPDCFGELQDLKFFSIQSNNLLEIPASTFKIFRRIHFDFSNNYELRTPLNDINSMSLVNYGVEAPSINVYSDPKLRENTRKRSSDNVEFPWEKEIAIKEELYRRIMI